MRPGEHDHLFTVLPSRPVRLGNTDKPPCETCTAECCCLVPITEEEGQRIAGYINARPELEARLAAQPRPQGKCPFVDMETYRCGVYEERPLACRMFGYTSQLMCSYAPDLANRFADELGLAVRANWAKDRIAILGGDLTWDTMHAAYVKKPVRKNVLGP